MTLLLKSMWMNMLRSPLNRSIMMSRSVTTSVSEIVRTRPPPDSVMSSLREAPSAEAVLSAVQTHLPVMTHKHLLQALRSLFELQKSGKMSQDPQYIIKNPAFSVLCQNFKKYARALEVKEAIEAVKVLSYLEVPIDSLIVQTMLQLVRYSINDLNIRQIMFLDFLLSRYDTKNHLVDALKLALPLVFQIRLPLELDKEDLALLRDMLAYASSHDLPERCVNNIVTGLLLHDQALDAQTAKSVVWSLCQVNCTADYFPTRVQLLHICSDILTENINQLSYDDVLRTAAKIKVRILEKHSEYYHEQLMDAIADYVVRHRVDFEKALLVARVLSRIAHTNLGLVEYLCEVAASEPGTLSSARTNILFGFVNCLSNNNYLPAPDQWAVIKEQICNNPIMEAKKAALPWAKLCLELASLGLFEQRLVARVLSPDFLREYLARDHNTLDYLQLLTLHEAVRAFHSSEYGLPADTLARARSLVPLPGAAHALADALARGLGASDVLATNVVLPSGFVADVVVCLKNGYPVKLTKPEGLVRIPIEQLNISKDCIILCVMNFNQGCFSMNSNRLRGTFRLLLDVVEAGGCAAVPVDHARCLAAPPHERDQLLLRDLASKAAEYGVKLCSLAAT